MLPGVLDLDPEPREVADIPGRQRKRRGPGRARDEGVRQPEKAALTRRFGANAGRLPRPHRIQFEDAAPEGASHLTHELRQSVALSTGRQPEHSVVEFMQDDDRQQGATRKNAVTPG